MRERAYDKCPRCGGYKTKVSALCLECYKINIRSNRRPKKCKNCGKKHYNRRLYCSDKCQRFGEGCIEITCDNCGKKRIKPQSLVKGDRNFCDRKCKHDYYRSKRTCKWCGKTEIIRNSYADRPFCGIKCYSKWISHNLNGENHPNWKGGWEPYYGKDWHRQRKKCLNRDKKTCQNCGITAKEIGSENMDVHHIVPYMKSHDNSLSNLIALCDPCHHAVEHGKIKLLEADG